MTTTFAFDISLNKNGSKANADVRLFTSSQGSLSVALPVTGATSLVDFADECGFVQFVIPKSNLTIVNIAQALDQQAVGALYIQRLNIRRYYRVIGCAYTEGAQSTAGITLALDRPKQIVPV